MQPPTAQIASAQSQGQANQNALNSQSSGLQNQYNNAVNQSNGAFNNANNYTSAIQNGGQLYGQNLNAQENALGFNPASVGHSANMLTAIQNQVANAPNAAQQAGNYYGTSAGGTTNIYSGMMGNLNPALTNATNNMANQTQLYSAAQNAANQQAGLSVTSENNAATQANQTYATAVAQMNTAQQAMSAIESLVQSQGTATANQIAAYQNAYANYVSAQAVAQQATVATQIAPSTIAAQNAAAAAAQASILKNQSPPKTTTPAKTTTKTTTPGVSVTSAIPGLGASNLVKK